MAQAAASLILIGAPPRTVQIYGGRAKRYVLIEGGAIVQAVLLQAVDLGLSGVCIGAY